ncbi:hypothetical protein DSM104443_02461 [Usitatibacter rugosus]|uniref:Acetoacetate decarboxylase n=1 Tax=Usitatibacter rugosus TaxID=2732067 RepID=A0A6M4GW12_9PROT|nr:hypothetical protein [Usitatibacter rugosus]QJR11386.1 hypothetical protein DSM104443_02461 [Usitatibacter rugosus]
MHAFRKAMIATVFAAAASGANAQSIDNSAIGKPEFREHKATYGVVYRLPKDVTDILDSKVYPPLRERLVKLGLVAEARTFNLQHVTVVHIHSADPSTPKKMLAAFPKAPPVLTLTLKNFYNTEAAAGAGAPWWFDLGVVKSGQGYTEMMKFNTVATAAMAPLRDGPLPRVTGPVYEKMGDAGKDLVKTVGVSGVNIVKDGKETASHNPHNTLVYSMVRWDDRLKTAMNEFAAEMNAVLPNGIDTQFREVSIVEIGFMGNVLREFYRVGLADGSAYDVVNGQPVKAGS